MMTKTTERRFSACLLMVFLFLPACSIVSAEEVIWIDVPFVKQSKNLCGAASILMVMRYWERSQGKESTTRAPSLADIGREIYSREAKGVLGQEMERYFEARGFEVFIFKATSADLQQHISKGRPLIVCLKAGRSFHYIVVVGYDVSRGLVLVNDPAEKKLLQVSVSAFEKKWESTNGWTLLAVPAR